MFSEVTLSQYLSRINMQRAKLTCQGVILVDPLSWGPAAMLKVEQCYYVLKLAR